MKRNPTENSEPLKGRKPLILSESKDQRKPFGASERVKPFSKKGIIKKINKNGGK